MGEAAVVVVDTNVLVNLMTPVVDGRSIAPSGEDPFMAVLTAYDVHVPESVIGEVSAATGSNDLLSAAAAGVLRATQHLTVHEGPETEPPGGEYGLDTGESHGIWLANELDAAMFVTDEFSTPNYLLIALALSDRNTLFTTPHVLCGLAANDVVDPRYVDALLTYYVHVKAWDRVYIHQLRTKYL